MEYISHKNTRNPYPLDSNSETGVDKNYIAEKRNDITLLGKFKGNFIDFTRISPNDIQVLDESHTFRFILNIDGKLYTSNSFKQDLQDAFTKNNPYFNKESVAVIPLSLNVLTTPNRNTTNSENYAEVEVLSNLNTGDTLKNIVNHINWLSSSSNKELRDVTEMGSWRLKTTSFNISEDSGLGFELTEIVEQEKLGKTLESEPIEGLAKQEPTQTKKVNVSEKSIPPSPPITSPPPKTSTPGRVVTSEPNNYETQGIMRPKER